MQGGLDRREFILGGLKVSLTFALCDALAHPALAQGGFPFAGKGRVHDATIRKIPEMDSSLQVIAAYLARYTPPEGRFPSAGPWRATFDLLEWDGSPIDGSFYRSNRVVGSTVVDRRSDASGVGYEVSQSIRMQRFRSTLRSSMRCSADLLPRLLEWTSSYRSRPEKGAGAALGLEEAGRHHEGVLEISSRAGLRRFETGRAVAPQWAVWDALRGARADRMEPALAAQFDLLHDLTSYRPGQCLQPYGILQVALKGRNHELHGFIQTGAGTEPTHLWLDAEGRPLLATAGLLSCALVAVEA